MSEVETYESTEPGSSTPKNGFFRVLLAVALIGVPVAGGYQLYSELSSAKAVKEQNDKLMSVKTFLDENGAKLKVYSGLSAEAMAQQAGAINTILLQTIEEMKKAKSAADGVGKSDVRFNPVMFEELELALDIAIQKLSPANSTMNRLNQESARMAKSQDGWGFYNSMVAGRGINPQAVMYMSYLVMQLKNLLTELKTSVVALEKPGTRGCSNNYFVDQTITEKFGEGHCKTSNRPFCKALEKVVNANKVSGEGLTPVQIAAVQRELVASGLLPEGAENGYFNDATKKAFSDALGSGALAEPMKGCAK